MVIGTNMMCPAKAENSSDTTNEDNRESMLHAYDLGFSCKWNWISDYIMDDLIMTCLLLLPESKKTDTGDLDDLETDTGNITLRLTPATEAGDQNLVVLVDKVEATIVLRGARWKTQSAQEPATNHTIKARAARERTGSR